MSSMKITTMLGLRGGSAASAGENPDMPASKASRCQAAYRRVPRVASSSPNLFAGERDDSGGSNTTPATRPERTQRQVARLCKHMA